MSRINRMIATAAIGIAVICLTACGNKTYSWREQVVLSTGERLILGRSVHLERASGAFNPFKSEWFWREWTITLLEGPTDLQGMRYEARVLPMLVERDPSSKELTVVGITFYCDDRLALNPHPGQRYFAFAFRSGGMAQVPVPEWAWGRSSNLLKPNADESPPREVHPGLADQFNRNESRGEAHYLRIDRSVTSNC